MNDLEYFTGRYSNVVKVSEDAQYLQFTANDNIGRELAITSLSPQGRKNPLLVESFTQQARFMGAIDDRYFTKLIDYISPNAGSDETHAAVTLRMPSNIGAVASAEPLHPMSVLAVLRQVLRAAKCMHDRGYLHLCISADCVGANASLSDIKLTSVGSCYPLAESGADIPLNDGSAKYGAPELYGPGLGHDGDTGVDASADVYSIGMLGYELLAGPENFARVFRHVQNEKDERLQSQKWINWHRGSDVATAISDLDSAVSASLSDVIGRMMAKDRSVRYQSIDECIRALELISDPLYIAPEDGTVSEKKSNLLYWVAGVVVCLSVVGAGVAYLLQPKTPEYVQQVSDEEFVSMANRNNNIREQIEKLKLEQEPNEDYKVGMDYYLQAKNAEDENVDQIYEYLRNSTTSLGTFFTDRTQERKQGLAASLKGLHEEATNKGTVNLPEIDFSLAEKEQSTPQLTTRALESLAQIQSEYEAGISVNPREFAYGSSKEQIQNAYDLCKSYSESCDRDWYSDELIRSEILKPFIADKYEVDVNSFREYADNGNIITRAEERNRSSKTQDNELQYTVTTDLFWHNQFPQDRKRYPVTHVTRLDASRYCRSVGKRLPSEAEWEYSARNGSGDELYPWGSAWTDRISFRGEPIPQPNELVVGSFQPYPSGLYDLTGSVSEWTSTEDGAEGVVKGASRFDKNPANLRTAVRKIMPIDYSGDDVGFRCVEELDQWRD